MALACLALPVFLLGAIDDRIDLPAKLRLAIQLGIGFCLVLVFNISVSELDALMGNGSLMLTPVFSLLFTTVCTAGVLNAVNMSDGIDGLLGSTACVSLLAISFLAYQAGAFPEASISMLCFGLILGYLVYNLGAFGVHRRIFLGDSGSMLVGLVLLILLIVLSQGAEPVITPTSAGWLLGLPLLDTVSVMIRRVLDGRSPLSAGRDHFHHILQDLGISRSNTLKTLVLIQIIFVLIGLSANRTDVPQSFYFWSFVIVTALQFVSISLAASKIGNGCVTENGLEKNELRQH
ncbi:MAG: MraY family glycosyltransferase [Gammaproteobacteria bacterium]